MLDNEVQPSFRSILNSNCAWIIPSPFIYWQQKFSNLLIRFIPTWECPARTSWLELGEPDDVEKKKNEEKKQFEKAPHKLTLSNQCSDC